MRFSMGAHQELHLNLSLSWKRTMKNNRISYDIMQFCQSWEKLKSLSILVKANQTNLKSKNFCKCIMNNTLYNNTHGFTLTFKIFK